MIVTNEDKNNRVHSNINTRVYTSEGKIRKNRTKNDERRRSLDSETRRGQSALLQGQLGPPPLCLSLFLSLLLSLHKLITRFSSETFFYPPPLTPRSLASRLFALPFSFFTCPRWMPIQSLVRLDKIHNHLLSLQLRPFRFQSLFDFFSSQVDPAESPFHNKKPSRLRFDTSDLRAFISRLKPR
jgi:hypothetical protein